MRHRIGVLLIAAAFAGLAPAPAALAQDTAQAQVFSNRIEGLEVAEQGGTLYVRLTMSEALASPPPSFSVANPARIAFDFAATANGLGRNVQAIDRGDLRSANIVQAGDRTRLVLNLTRVGPYEARVQGRDLIIALSPAVSRVGQSTVASEVAANFAEPRATVGGLAVRDINFRRGAAGEGRVVVDLSSSDAGIDIRREGGSLVIDFLYATLPEHLRRRSDVTDFATPVTSMSAQQVGDRVRLTVLPNGLWEHNAYQTDNRFVLEVNRVQEDINRLVKGASGRFKGEKLSLNFQDIDVRAVLQVIAEFTNINIVASDAVTGKVTLRLRDVPWDQALEVVLQAKGLSYVKTGDVIWVATIAEIDSQQRAEANRQTLNRAIEPLQTEVFQINYHEAELIAELIRAQEKSALEIETSNGTGAARSVPLAASGPGQDVRTRQSVMDTGRVGLLSERGSVTADKKTNKIFINDIAAARENVAKFLKEVDMQARQVLIEARIVEARTDFARDLGVRLGFGGAGGRVVGYTADGAPVRRATVGAGLDPTNTAAGLVSGVPVGSPRSTNVDLPAAPSYGNAGLVSMVLWNNAATRFLNLELSALESSGRGRVVSSPRILTANLAEAMIRQGDKINVRVSTDDSSTVKEIDASLKLTVTPTITPDGKVQLAVQIMKDRADFSRVVDGIPAIESREANSTVLVENGGTVVIGGVFEEDESSSEIQVPLLGDIPVVGNLFKTRVRRGERRELLIFITPRIVSDALTLR